MPPSRRPPAIRDNSDMVDENALHITHEQAQIFGSTKVHLKQDEYDDLQERAEKGEHYKQQNEQNEQLVKQLQEQLENQANGLLVQEGGLVVQGFQFSPIGLIAPEHFSSEAWEQIGHLLLRLEGSIQWLIGDWLAYGDSVKWGDATKFADTFGRDPGTLHNYASVSRAIQFSFRNENLSYTHHVAVSSLTPEWQKYALDYASQQKKLSVSKFRQWIVEQTAETTQDDIRALPSAPSFAETSRDINKLMKRNPATLKPEERMLFLTRLAEMKRMIAEAEHRLGQSNA